MRVLFMLLIVAIAGAVEIFSQENSAEKFFKKGTEFAKVKEHEQAIESFENALKVKGSTKKQKAKIQYNIGACLYQLKKFEDAEKAFTKAIKISKSKHLQAIYSLGLTQIELKESGVAEANFRKVLRLNEKHAEAWFDLGMLLLERKMYKNAKIAFEKSIEYKTTRSSEAQNNLGVISAIGGNIELAKYHFQTAFVRSNKTLLLARENLEYWRRQQFKEFSNRLAIK